MSLRVISVRTMQLGLRNAGYDPGTIDGRWGVNTYNAWARWFSAQPERFDPGGEMAAEFESYLCPSPEAPVSECQQITRPQDFGALGVQTLELSSLMVAELTRLSTAPPPTTAPVNQTLPPPIFDQSGAPPPPLPSTTSDVEGMLARLGVASDADVSSWLAPATGGPPLSSRRRIVPQTSGGGTTGWIVGGLVLAGVAGLGYYFWQRNR